MRCFFLSISLVVATTVAYSPLWGAEEAGSHAWSIGYGEADITPAVMRWFKLHYPRNVALEVKVDGNKTTDHQEAALQSVRQGTFSWKIPDMGARNPFDCLIIKNSFDAFVVTCTGRRCHVTGSGKSFYINV